MVKLGAAVLNKFSRVGIVSPADTDFVFVSEYVIIDDSTNEKQHTRSRAQSFDFIGS